MKSQPSFWTYVCNFANNLNTSKHNHQKLAVSYFRPFVEVAIVPMRSLLLILRLTNPLPNHCLLTFAHLLLFSLAVDYRNEFHGYTVALFNLFNFSSYMVLQAQYHTLENRHGWLYCRNILQLLIYSQFSNQMVYLFLHRDEQIITILWIPGLVLWIYDRFVVARHTTFQVS